VTEVKNELLLKTIKNYNMFLTIANLIHVDQVSDVAHGPLV
jgi:hypothetical protein